MASPDRDGLTIADVPDIARAVYERAKAYVDKAVKASLADLQGQLARSADMVIAAAVARALDDALKPLRGEIGALREQCLGAVAAVTDAVRSMPAPVVNVAQPDIRISPRIQVDVPRLEQPSITVNAPDINLAPTFNVPKQDQPTINVQAPVVNVAPAEVRMPELNLSPTFNVPKQDQPTINVNVPRRKIKKLIDYDDGGRPSIITETEE